MASESLTEDEQAPERLCGSSIAHSMCRFAGAIHFDPLKVRCAAQTARFFECEYHDLFGFEHRRARQP